jgi:membrane protein implicated in regulation of membrane protease activity
MDFSSLVPYIWLFLGLLFIGLEFAMPGFVIFFFGTGALLTSLLCWLVPGLDAQIPLQIIIWLITSFLSLGFLRRFFRGTFRGRLIQSDDEEEFRGKLATVTEAISENHPGRVTFQGTTWKAVTYDEPVKPGDVVEIMKKENLTLIVSKRE